MAECSPLSGARRFGLRAPIDPISPELNMQRLGRVSSPDTPTNHPNICLLALPTKTCWITRCTFTLVCSPYQLLNVMKPLFVSVVFDPSNHERVKADSETLMHTTWRA